MSDDVVAKVLQSVRKIADTFTKPTDDFLPVVLVFHGEEYDVLRAEFANPEEKNALFSTALPMMILEKQATAIIHITSAWFTKAASDDDARKKFSSNFRPSLQANRRECVLVAYATADGLHSYMGEIIRTKTRAPAVEELSEIGAQNRLLAIGIEALKHVRENPDPA